MLSIDEEARRRFESDWLAQESQSISIREYLPGAGAESYLGTLEELVCIDLEFRWRHSRSSVANSDQTVSADNTAIPTRVEDYLREFPELNVPDVVARLVEQEIAARAGAGFIVEPSEYRSRFPGIDLKNTLFTADGETRVDGDSPSQSGGSISAFPYSFGPYVLTGRIGRGGMGSVYRARQPAAGREVAIKIADVSSPSAIARETVAQRFETEAHAAAGIVHDNVVPIFDVGTIDGQPYYAMRLVEGGDLSGLTKEATLPAKVAARYVADIARGVAAAHQRGMLHRDIKPQNILIDPATNRALLTDFGLARAMAADSSLTHAGQVLGTPSYMPPEQVKDSSKIDERADVYALGGTLYQAVTGRAPFKASDIHETLRQVLNDDPIPAQQLNSSVPVEIDTIAAKCLEKDAQRRYQTAAELADELERYLAGKPILARPVSRLTKLAKWAGRNRGLAAALSLATATTIVALAVSAYGWARTTELLHISAVASQTTLTALDDITSAIDDDPTFNLPDVADKRRELLARVLKHYKSLIGENAAGASGEIEHAVALTLAGRLTLELDRDQTAAEKYFQAAIDISQKVESDNPEIRAIVLRTQSDALVGLGNIARQNKEWADALAAYQTAEELRHKWADIDDSMEAHRKVASAMMNQGLMHRRLGNVELAATRQIDAQRIRNRFLRDKESIKRADRSDLDRLRRDSGKANFNLGMLALADNDSGEAADRLGAATREFRQLAEATSSDTKMWRLLAESLIYEAEVAGMLHGFHQDATELLQEAIDDLLPLIAISKGKILEAAELTSLAQVALDGLIANGEATRTSGPNDGAVGLLPSAQWDRLQLVVDDLSRRLAAEQKPRDESIVLSVRSLELTALRQKALLVSESTADALAALDQAVKLCDQSEQELAAPESQMRINDHRSAIEHLRSILATNLGAAP